MFQYDCLIESNRTVQFISFLKNIGNYFLIQELIVSFTCFFFILTLISLGRVFIFFFNFLIFVLLLCKKKCSLLNHLENDWTMRLASINQWTTVRLKSNSPVWSVSKSHYQTKFLDVDSELILLFATSTPFILYWTSENSHILISVT